MSANRYSIFVEALNASKNEEAGKGKSKSNIINAVEKTPELPPVNLHREYHDDYARHRDRSDEKSEGNKSWNDAPKSLHS